MTSTRTLAVDIGGTSVKAATVGADGVLDSDIVRVSTPYPCPPGRLVGILGDLAARLPVCDRAGIGFPGVLRDGRVVWVNSLMRAVFNGPPDDAMVRAWRGFDLTDALSIRLAVPVRMANDADVAALASVLGTGLECVITLGTGLGFSLVDDGRLVPHLELSEMPFLPGRTFEDVLGQRGLDTDGPDAWRDSLLHATEVVRRMTTFDHLYLGGGNARLVDPAFLGDDMSIASNVNGLVGAHHLWSH